MLSVIIPSYREPLLQKTVDSILENAAGEVEVLPVLDGWEPDPPLKDDRRVRPIKVTKNRGMRASINIGLAMAKGEYIAKTDAHCIFAPGFDEILVDNCAENWVVIPVRYSLDEANWRRNRRRRGKKSHYLTFPTPMNHRYGFHMAPATGNEWDEMRGDGPILDTMSCQGSFYLFNKEFFMRTVGYLDDRPETYNHFGCDYHEVLLGYWLDGGEAKCVTETWYAHLSKRLHHYHSGHYSWTFKKSYHAVKGYEWSTKHWLNEEHGRPKKFAWLIEKFWPVPGWPDDWPEVWASYGLK